MFWLAIAFSGMTKCDILSLAPFKINDKYLKHVVPFLIDAVILIIIIISYILIKIWVGHKILKNCCSVNAPLLDISWLELGRLK
jgi:hypothetical protein